MVYRIDLCSLLRLPVAVGMIKCKLRLRADTLILLTKQLHMHLMAESRQKVHVSSPHWHKMRLFASARYVVVAN